MEENQNLQRPRHSPAKAILIMLGAGFVLVCGSYFSGATLASSHIGVSARGVGAHLVASCLGVVLFVSACLWGIVAFVQGRL